MSLLLTSIADLRQYVSFSGDLEYDSLKPALRSAQVFLSRYVGPVLLTQLETQTPSADQTALLPYVKAPIAALALLKFVNAGNVRITDLGVMRTKTGDSQDAFEWQLERVVLTLKAEAFEGIEALLRYLGGNLTTFTAYADSAEYKAQKGSLIESAEVFSTYYDIGGSRLILQTLSASMRTAALSVQKVLGNALPDLLAGSNLTETQAAQLDAARRALAYLTIARALREKLVTISDTGVQVCGISNFGTLNYKQPASDKQLETSIRYFDEQAAGFVADLLTVLTPTSPEPAPRGLPIAGTKIVAF
ncbi:DUF6712 family protein [Spirosoma areae]